MPAAQQANLGMQAAADACAEGATVGTVGWFTLRLLVCRNVGLPRSPAAVADSVL